MSIVCRRASLFSSRALYVLLALALDLGTADTIQPVGVGGTRIQFDAVIEVNPPLVRDQVLLFARYWVAPEYYRLAVVWAEPFGMRLCFPVYPPSLTVCSAPHSFSLRHDLFPQYCVTYPKPLGNRGVFDWMYGDYPVQNIRFADAEAVASRIYLSDFGGVAEQPQAGERTALIHVANTQEQTNRQVTALKVTFHDGILNGMEVLGTRSQLLKKVEYDYDRSAQPPQLRRQTVFLPERPMTVSLRGEGVTVKVNDAKYQFKEFPTIYEPGGRKCTVEYETIDLGGARARLPVRIEVRGGRDNELLRSVRLTNFQNTGFSSQDAERAATEFAGFGPAHRMCREIMEKYWEQPPERLSVSDVAITKGLLERFGHEPSSRSETVGEKLRRLNTLVALSRLIGDEARLEQSYELYLSTLVKSGLLNMVLVGGYGTVEASALSGRFHEAISLTSRWLHVASSSVDTASALRFAATELDRGNFWAARQLVESLSNRRDLSCSQQFEKTGIKCAALLGLRELLNGKTAPQTDLAKAQVALSAATTGAQDSEKQLIETLAEAQRLFKRIDRPTTFQKSLEARLVSLDTH